MMATNFDGREWATLGERGELLAGEGWRYARTGQVRHLTKFQSWGAHCGLWMPEEQWHGTGSQDEYERLARLPKCLTCMNVADV